MENKASSTDTLTKNLGLTQAHIESECWPNVGKGARPMRMTYIINNSINTHGPQQLRGTLSLIS